MPANDPLTTGLYLRGLLAAGARPFTPPSGVYRLLGQAPPQHTAVRFPPPLPPVGFVYEGLARLGPGTAGTAGPGARSQEQEGDGAELHPGSRLTAEPPPAPVRPQPTVPPPVGGTGDGGERATSSSVVPRAPESALTPAPSVRGRPAGGEEEPPGDSVFVERAAVQQGTASAAPGAEKRTGLAIPGLTQRRAIFAALAGALPHEQQESAPPVSRTPAPAGTDSRPVAEPPSAGRLLPPPSLSPSGATRAAASPARTPSVEEGPAFRARTRVVEEVEHVRRAVAAQADRVTPEAVREVAREAVREVVREERTEKRSEGRPDRSGAPAPAPVVVVQRVEGAQRRAPRAFWSSSALRSPHLRMLR